MRWMAPVDAVLVLENPRGERRLVVGVEDGTAACATIGRHRGSCREVHGGADTDAVLDRLALACRPGTRQQPG